MSTRRSLPRTMVDEEFTFERREVSPAHLLIKIESFSSLSEIGILKHESQVFAAGGFKWRLVVYPDGNVKEQEEDHVSAYIAMAEIGSLPAGWEVHAMFSIFLYDQISDNYLCFRGNVHRFHAVKHEWGFSKLISMKTLRDSSNGYLVDDNCVIGAEVFVIKNERVIEHLSVKRDADHYEYRTGTLEFSKLPSVWTSAEFTTGGCKWTIEFHPNGDGNAKGQSCSIYLRSVSIGQHTKVKADFCLRIKNCCTDYNFFKRDYEYDHSGRVLYSSYGLSITYGFTALNWPLLASDSKNCFGAVDKEMVLIGSRLLLCPGDGFHLHPLWIC